MKEAKSDKVKEVEYDRLFRGIYTYHGKPLSYQVKADFES
jgi:hypothetical protein